MTEEDKVAGYKSRADRLAQMLRARTNGDGEALPGYKANVAAIRAELNILQEQIAQAGVKHNGN